MENNSSKLVITFIAGAAVGAAIAYLFTSGKKDEILEELKQTASKIKTNLKSTIDSGKEVVDELSKQADDILGV